MPPDPEPVPHRQRVTGVGGIFWKAADPDALDAMLAQLRAEGVTVVGSIHEMEFGRFGWILDPEGNKIELWEPVEGV